MKQLSGIPVSSGVAIGTAVVLNTEGHRCPARHVEAGQIEAEVLRLVQRGMTNKQAAGRLGTSPDWLYRHARQLPFTVRLATRQLRFSAQPEHSMEQDDCRQ